MKKDGIVILPGESKHLDILKSEARNHGLKNLFFSEQIVIMTVLLLVKGIDTISLR